MAKLLKFRSLRIILGCLLLAAILFVPASYSKAVSTAELNTLKSKLNQTQQQKSTKATQAAELQKQVTVVDQQIDQTETSINQTQGQIKTTEKSIANLDTKIQEEQSNLDREQEKMSQVIASWYMEGESGLLEAVVGANNLSDLLDKQQYYESIRQQIQTNAEKIQSIKNDLSKQKDEQNAQLQVLNGLKGDQISQQNELEDRKDFKSRLLSDTTSALSDLKKQETDLKAKIDAMTAQLTAAMSNGAGIRYQGGDVLPSNDWWYQTQLRNYTIFRGTNPSYNITVNTYGCFITSIAMMASYYGHGVTNTDIAARLGTFSSDGYLQSSNSLAASLGISMGSIELANKAKLDSELDSGHPVIAGVRLDGWRGSHPNYVAGQGFDHFIVIKSRSGDKYYMHDPAQGKGYRLNDVVGIKTVRPL